MANNRARLLRELVCEELRALGVTDFRQVQHSKHMFIYAEVNGQQLRFITPHGSKPPKRWMHDATRTDVRRKVREARGEKTCAGTTP